MTQNIFLCTLDFGKLLEAANAESGTAVDWDILGNPISKYDTLLTGAYGPGAARLIKMAVLSHAGEDSVILDRAQLLEMSNEAFDQAVDHDFAGNVITDYSLVLDDDYGFGKEILHLARLAIQRQAEFFSEQPLGGIDEPARPPLL